MSASNRGLHPPRDPPLCPRETGAVRGHRAAPRGPLGTAAAGRWRALVLVTVVALGGCAPGTHTRPDGDYPEDLLALRTLAREAYQQGQWQQGEAYYRELARRVPVEVEPWFRLGNIYARLERPDEAVSAYREALVRDPEHAKAWYNMGVLQLRQAMNSFARMRAFVPADDPLHAQGQGVYRQLQEIMRGGGEP